MTKLASRLLRDGLDAHETESCIVREDSPLPAAGTPQSANT